MRDFKNMKRQRGRNRSGGGGQGGGRPQQNANRAFESNGPENVKIRGHAQHVFEKYQQLARDAFSSGDRVVAENYLQHADHYFRLLRTIQPNRSPSEILGRDTMASGLDIDFEEEIEAQPEDAAVAETGEGGEMQGGFEPRQDGARQDGNRQDANRYDRDNRQDRYEPREGGWRDRNERSDGNRQDANRQDNRVGFDRQDRNERPYGDRQDRNRNYGDRVQEGERFDGQRNEGQRNDGQRNDRYEGRRDNRRFDNRREDGRRDDRNVQRDSRDSRYEPRAEGFAEGPQPATPDMSDTPQTTPAVATEGADAAPVLRSQDGGMSEAPAFLQAASAESEEARPRVRRRRAPRSFQGGEESAETAAPEATPAAEES